LQDFSKHRYLKDSENYLFKNNQGWINAKVERLYHDDPAMLLQYTDTLTEDQRNHARCHMVTVLELEKVIDE